MKSQNGTRVLWTSCYKTCRKRLPQRFTLGGNQASFQLPGTFTLSSAAVSAATGGDCLLLLVVLLDDFCLLRHKHLPRVTKPCANCCPISDSVTSISPCFIHLTHLLGNRHRRANLLLEISVSHGSYARMSRLCAERAAKFSSKCETPAGLLGSPRRGCLGETDANQGRFG
jgi:hypothetical protein